MAHPTMEDVARAAGVSRALVSLVMNDSTNVSEERRRRVLEAAAQLGYRRNAVARQLASRRTRTIGVLLNDLHNPFFAEVYDGLQAAAHALGLRPLLTTASRRSEGDIDAIEVMLEHRVDGMVLVSPRLPPAKIVAASDIVPVVVIGSVVKSRQVDSVTNDEHEGTRLVVRHLVDLGHQSITHIHGGAGAGALARWRGYEAAMRGNHLVPDVIPGDFTESAGAEAARLLLKRKNRPTAIFGANDMVAVGALDVLESAGLRVPDDVSLVGYDNNFLARMHHISLTSVDQSIDQMGRAAIELLEERIITRRQTSELRLVTPTLVARRSTGPASVLS
ncbi:MAG: LacI family DNA-binding transcriptional regulator [Acidimicrobiales bacterium]